MKAVREHRVPLPDVALDIVRRLHNYRINDFVFPGMKADRPLSNMAMPMIMRRMEIEFTVHGFRSAFRDWAGDRTSFRRDLAEGALAHAIRDQTEAAYRRSDALERRRKMMTAWANFLANTQTAKVIPLRAK